MLTNLTHPPEILLVEDSPSDVLITREALAECGVLGTLHVVENGVDALAFLRREGRFSGAPRPDIVLLDLNLPMKGGLEVLEEVKTDDALRSTPIIVLTTSGDERDMLSSYDLHANGFVTKPVEFDEFVEVVRSIDDFWLHAATLPTVAR